MNRIERGGNLLLMAAPFTLVVILAVLGTATAADAQVELPQAAPATQPSQPALAVDERLFLLRALDDLDHQSPSPDLDEQTLQARLIQLQQQVLKMRAHIQQRHLDDSLDDLYGSTWPR